MEMFKRNVLLGVLFASFGTGCALDQNAPPENVSTDATELEAAAARGRRCRDGAMVVTANPLATQAGLDVLAKGGNAVDAAIAVQLVLGLVEPQSSGLGGGAFAVYYDGRKRKLGTYDARETAPAAATESLFLNPDGTAMGFTAAVRSGKSVGVPGVPRLLETLHRSHGRLAWNTLFRSAQTLARNGFAISPRLNQQVAATLTGIQRDPVASAYFLNADGTPKAVGTVLTNPAYATTLDLLERSGANGFYRGRVAQDIVTSVTTDAGGASSMTLADLDRYRVIPREPVCGNYRGLAVCGMGAPSSGGVAVIQMLGMLERFDMRAAGAQSLRSVHLFTQANRLAFADRAKYLADPAFVSVPTGGLIDPAYIASRSALINETADMGTATAGTPPNNTAWTNPDPSPPSLTGTSHLSIRDKDGNVVSMTTTVESAFGNNKMVDGFMLNNELTDFSFTPTSGGAPVANKVEGGKRPRSSMAPTIVFDPRGSVKYVTGSVGGSSIIPAVAKQILALVDWQQDPQAAATLPHFYNLNGSTTLETFVPGLIGPQDVSLLAPNLQGMGHTTSITSITSGIATIAVDGRDMVGGVDPRREGTVGIRNP